MQGSTFRHFASPSSWRRSQVLGVLVLPTASSIFGLRLWARPPAVFSRAGALYFSSFAMSTLSAFASFSSVLNDGS